MDPLPNPSKPHARLRPPALKTLVPATTRTGIFLTLLCMAAATTGHAADNPAPAAPPELVRLIELATATNPQVLAAVRVLNQAIARHEETLEFLDPRLVAVLGRAERSRTIPGATDGTGTTNNATALQGGVEAAVRPGFHLSVGAAERRLDEPGDDYGHLYQTLLGAQVRIPFARDRGFRTWDFTRAAALADYNDAAARLLQAVQTLRHDVELAYVAVLEAQVTCTVARQATARFETLLNEARELVRLEVIPEYQLLPAQMEFERRNEEELEAWRVLETATANLHALVGRPTDLDAEAGARILVEWAGRMSLPDRIRPDDVFAARGNYRSLLCQIESADLDLRIAREDLRPDVALEMRATFQGENETIPIGTRSRLSNNLLGGEAVVVYRHSLGQRGKRSRIRRLTERVAELEERLRQNQLETERALTTAMIQFRKSSERLTVITRALTAAQQALQAEEERFRLGEGTSRNVLDAQKDLTAVEQRRTKIGSDVLRSHSDFMFSSGYSYDHLQPAVPGRQE